MTVGDSLGRARAHHRFLLSLSRESPTELVGQVVSLTASKNQASHWSSRVRTTRSYTSGLASSNIARLVDDQLASVEGTSTLSSTIRARISYGNTGGS